MFAVPGWSLATATPKQQTTSSDPSAPVAVSKKRKRGRATAPNVNVNGENVADLWQTYIEGVPKKPKLDAKGSRTAATLPGNPVVEAQQDGPQGHHAPAQKKKKTKKSTVTDTEYASKGSNPEGVESRHSQTRNDSLSASNISAAPTNLTPLQASMRQKLIAARFRHLNETLYTTHSSNAIKTFSENPEFFHEYHEGFRKQVSVWPENPVEGYIRELETRGRKKWPGKHQRGGGKDRHGPTQDGHDPVQPLPRTDGLCTVADLGCGDAALAQRLEKSARKLKLKILSFDLQSPNNHVTKADISSLPLNDGSVDVAIFCLALMGTNWIDFIEEAWRVLRWKGELWVAEIKSRFGRVQKKRVDHSVGNRKKNKKSGKAGTDEGHEQDQVVAVADEEEEPKQDTDVSAFIGALEKRGFALRRTDGLDLTNKMFVRMAFIKLFPPVRGKNASTRPSTEKAGGDVSWHKPKLKFLDQGNDDEVDEASILKPCVYKIR